MGSEPWSTSSPWSSDIDAVLSATRERVFSEGSYKALPNRPFATLADLDAFFMRSPEDEDFDEEDDFSEGAGGTCSILDIRGVDGTRAPGVTAPLPDDAQLAIFGTTKPSTSQRTPERESRVFEGIGRGESLYVVFYDGNAPSEITFYGHSWD